MNWETVAYIGIYAFLVFLLVGIMIYGCLKEHVTQAGTEYERLVSREPVELDEIVPYPHEEEITNL